MNWINLHTKGVRPRRPQWNTGTTLPGAISAFCCHYFCHDVSFYLTFLRSDSWYCFFQCAPWPRSIMSPIAMEQFVENTSFSFYFLFSKIIDKLAIKYNRINTMTLRFFVIHDIPAKYATFRSILAMTSLVFYCIRWHASIELDTEL